MNEFYNALVILVIFWVVDIYDMNVVGEKCIWLQNKERVAEPISMSTPQMSYVNENSQSNMKEQRWGNNNNKWQFICRIYKRVCKCPWRLNVVFS